MKTRFLTALLVAAALLTSVSATAEPAARHGEATVIYGRDEAPTGEELRALLFGGEAPANVVTRGVVMMGAAAPAPAPVSGAPAAPRPVMMASAPEAPLPPAAPPPRAPSVSFTIEFAFNSAEVPKDYYPHLAAMAEALKDPRANGAATVIVGHTDTLGSAAYNETLSLARAEATRAVLVARFGVEAQRLIAKGAGEEMPLPGVPGDAGVNRRVEFALR